MLLDNTPEYKLIWDKFMSSQMAPATVANKTVEIEAGDYTLRAGTSKILFDGFLKLYNDAEEDEKDADAKIPDLNDGDNLAEERIKDINEAYKILSSPASKRKYDRVWNSKNNVNTFI